MDRPFSERVAHDDWRRAAEDWICRELDRHGHQVTGPIEQPRIRPWSTQLTVPTDAGPMWFKANCAAQAFEPALQLELVRLAPEAVDRPYAIEADRGWMLTVHRGETLADAHDPHVDDWVRVLRQAAELQRITAGAREALLATGLPDCGPPTVVARFDRIVEVLSALPQEHPAHVPAQLRSQLLAVRPRLVDAVDVLAASPLPTTWQHGDLHPNNAFADGRVFDFGDSQWASAVEMLSVPYGWITTLSEVSWPEVLEAYCDVWSTTAAAIAPEWDAAALTQPVNRTLLWWTCLQEASAAEWAEWGQAPVHHLSRVLDA
ncbi:phosphotransferase [Aeromicrobium sp. S22]|uniref:phosphotransferase n=1 Tax=Aeromicrobium sp. S22 TaxID=2662029 RepID=UPI00129ECD89|nr:phosphotransferase [Aeromicrobium sp. S22]MRJ99941.1 phosphotransferase [Aeromicrobium sp. S22]